MATSNLPRPHFGQHDLDQMLAEREKLNGEVQRILDERTPLRAQPKAHGREPHRVHLEKKAVPTTGLDIRHACSTGERRRPGVKLATTN